MVELSSKAQKAMVDVELLEGEQIAHVWQADGFFLGTNPAAKAAALIAATLVKLTGGHIRIFLVLTNQRVMMVQSRGVCCGCQRVRGVNSIALTSIKEAGVAKETQWCCINSRAIHVESVTQRYTMIVKSFKDDDLKQFLAEMSRMLVRNQSSI
jgi:hypothetical protein